jgi:hypothetical protein
MNLTLSSVFICRVNSADVNQATIGSATGLGISLGTTGVKTVNVTGTAQTPNVGDYINIVMVYTNGAMTSQSFQFQPTQLIDTPLI